MSETPEIRMCPSHKHDKSEPQPRAVGHLLCAGCLDDMNASRERGEAMHESGLPGVVPASPDLGGWSRREPDNDD